MLVIVCRQTLKAHSAVLISPSELSDKDRAAITRFYMAQSSKPRIASVLSIAEV
jgi:hypothetical protein